MKTRYWLGLYMLLSAFFGPLISEKLSQHLSDNAKRTAAKVQMVLYDFVAAFLALIGGLALASGQWSGWTLKAEIKESWLVTSILLAVCVAAIRYLRRKYPADESH